MRLRIDENSTINSLLDKYLLPEHSDTKVQHSLAFYQSFGHKGVAVLLKKDDPANLSRYFELDKNKSVKKNFYRKKIVEYPVFLVIPTHNLHMYNLIECDDEFPHNVSSHQVEQEPIVCE